jgi:hypothetical protein
MFYFYEVDVVVCWQDLMDDVDLPLDDVESATL